MTRNSVLEANRLPPLRPVIARTGALSCHKPGEFLMRAWAPFYSGDRYPLRLVEWILHHVGRIDLTELEWWGYTYSGRPSYMGDDPLRYASGLTIQRVVPRRFEWQTYAEFGAPIDLDIPERGIVRVAS